MEEVVVLVAGFLSINFLSYILYLIIINKFKESTREFYRDTILSISEEAREWVKESDKVYPLFKRSNSPLDNLSYNSLISTFMNSLAQIITSFRTLSTPKTTTEPSFTNITTGSTECTGPSFTKNTTKHTGPSCSKTTTGCTGPSCSKITTGLTGPCC